MLLKFKSITPRFLDIRFSLIVILFLNLASCGGGNSNWNGWHNAAGTCIAGCPIVSPSVLSTTPVNTATAVNVYTSISAVFSTAMDSASLTSTTFTVNNGVTGTVSYNGTTATFTPSINLAPSTTYTATINTTVKDVSGVAIAAPYSWTFTTAAAPVAPINVYAISGINNMTITWSPAVGANFYNIYWGTTSGITTSSNKIAGATSPYLQTGLAAGNTYY